MRLHATILLVTMMLASASPGAGVEARAPIAPDAMAGGTQRIYDQDTVVVLASRMGSRLRELATSGTVIPAGQIRRAGDPGVARLLADVPGLNVVDLSGSGSGALVESRGFTSLGHTSHLLVLVDEVPVNDLDGDRADWNLLTKSQLERIEVLRGPASYLWGNAAMAGVVNLVTRRGTRSGLQSLETSGGGYGDASGAASACWVGRSAEWNASGSFRRADGFRDHSSWNSACGFARVRAPLSARWQLNGHALLHRGDQDIPGALPDPLWRDAPGVARAAGLPDPAAKDWRREETLSAALGLTGPVARSATSTFMLAVDARDRDSRETIIPVGTLDHAARTLAVRGNARLDWKTYTPGKLELLLGAESVLGGLASRYYDPTSPTPGNPVGAGDLRRTSGAASILARLEPWPRLTLATGARLDWLQTRLEGVSSGSSSNLSALSPTASASYDLGGAGSVYATVGGSFKAPTLEQLYDPRPYAYDPDGPGPIPSMSLQVSSHTLQPQRGTHVETGFRALLPGGLTAEASGYYSRSKDEIGFDLAHFRYANIAHSTHSGLEASLAAELSPRAGARLSYAWTRAIFDGGEQDGKQINGVPLHQVSGSLTLVAWPGASLTASGRYLQQQWLDEMNLYELPPYAVADAGLTQVVGSLELFASASNLLDRHYAGVGYVTIDGMGNDLPLYYPGTGRTLLVGVRYPAPVRGGNPGRFH